ncbi:MAG: NAD(P)-dependent oxidoreductase, partial [Chloroflexota bacterium]|nr:NAD(P)-dependent oxidoreductase [Chloroflexota bacterium]
MKVVLLGAGGMLARAVQAAAPAGVALRPFTRGQLDITDAAAVRAAVADRPEWVINCAAWTRVDAAEEHERDATLINGDAVGLVAREAGAVGARVLHVSTDYVFDGVLGRPYREEDAPNPQGAYGRSKLAGERALAASGAEWTMIRTQWLYGGGASFVRTMWSRARQGLASRVVDDQWGAPTHVGEIAAVIWRLVGDGA